MTADTEPLFLPTDRVLIVAPHPDDEALATGGILQKTLKAGAAVKVLYLTNGEFNEISSITYRIKPCIVKSDYVKNGRMRKNEAVQAMAFMGLTRDDLVFLGYPDSGTLKIWQLFWGQTKPFKSFFTRINKVLNQDDLSFGHYYVGDSVLEDFKKVLGQFKPTHVFVTAPFDVNLDHQAAYLFLNAALLDVGKTLAVFPKVHLTIVHSPKWPKPKTYAPEKKMEPPAIAGLGSPDWRSIPLSDEEIERKKDLVSLYKSQMAYSRNFMMAFVRPNEIFLDVDYESVLRETGKSFEEVAADTEGPRRTVRYRIGPNELLIDIPLAYPPDEMGVLTSDIFGYRAGQSFAAMPKLSLRFFGNRLTVKDGKMTLSDAGVVYKLQGLRLLVRVPLGLLKNPDYLFVSTRTARDVVTPGFGAWRVLQLEAAGETP